MKTLLFLTSVLLLRSGVALTQDFRAVPPAEQPNAAELTYFGGKHPNAIPEIQLDQEAIALVSGFLSDLANNQLEAARNRLAEGFVAHGPGYNDKLKTDDLLSQWDRNGRLFANQQLTLETITPVNVGAGDNQGQWVYVKGIWSAPDGHGQGKPIRISFHHLARVSNNRIQRAYTSYGNDQLFYDLGIALYASPSGVVQR